MAFYWALGYLKLLTYNTRINSLVVTYKTNLTILLNMEKHSGNIFQSFIGQIYSYHKESQRNKCVGMGSCSLPHSNSVSAITLFSTSERVPIIIIFFSRKQSIFLRVMKFELQTANTCVMFSFLWNCILQRIRLPNLIFKESAMSQCVAWLLDSHR